MEHFLLSQKENKEHSTQFVPYSYYRSALPEGIPDVSLHWHTEMEINFVREGSGLYQIGEEHIISQPGDIIIAAPNVMHSVYPMENTSVVTDTLVFHLDFLGGSVPDKTAVSYIRPIINGSVKISPVINNLSCGYTEYINCIDKAFRYVKNTPDFFELGLKSELFKFIHELYINGDIKTIGTENSTRKSADKIKTALVYIHENYQSEINVNSLAQMCHFSQQYFISFFKKTVGVSCISYINQFRLKMAADLLKTTEMSVSDIAFECGFRNLSNFNRQFREYFKTTPKNFRKQIV